MLLFIIIALTLSLFLFIFIEGYILSPKRIADANRILAEANRAKTTGEIQLLTESARDIFEYDNKVFKISSVLFLSVIIVNIIYLIIFKPFE